MAAPEADVSGYNKDQQHYMYACKTIEDKPHVANSRWQMALKFYGLVRVSHGLGVAGTASLVPIRKPAGPSKHATTSDTSIQISQFPEGGEAG